MKRKLSTCFSLFVMLSSLLVSPLVAVAENTDDSTTNNQQLIENVEKEVITDNQNQESLDIETTNSEITSTKESETMADTETDKKQKSEMIERTDQQTRAPSNVITNITITDKNGNPLSQDVSQWENFRINGNFSLPNGLISAGDITTITLPAQLKFGNLTDFEVKDVSGNIVANATISPVTKQIVLTYTNYAESHSDVKGSFYFYAGIDTSVIKDEQIITTEIDIDGETFPIEIEFEGVGNDTHPLSKAGWFIEGDNQQLQYYLAVNRSKKNYPNAVLKDSLKSQAVSYVPESFKVYKGEWRRNSNNTDWELVNQVDVTSTLNINLSEDNRSFSIDFGNITEQDHFAVYYNAKMNYKPVDGEKINNTAILISDENVVTETTIETPFQEGGGEAEGYNLTIKIHKKDPSGNNLSGAEFEIIRDKTGEIVGKITTDNLGNASVSGLLRDNYTIRETKAPEGYELSKEDIKVSPADFNNNKEVFKEIINKKKEIKPTNIILSVNKVLTGKELTAGAFNFELKDEAGKVLQT
ncbi:Ig-like domain-containing protein, partial [Vagococcus carniphilus]|uniref:Ig-like domain-containing protein n=1 Tax=Vagococcus carniphilus TaxID=218144 RepID=UPI0028912492